MQIALSIRQPWAWLIVNGYKDIENRTWHTRQRGPVLIHASNTLNADEYNYVRHLLAHHSIYAKQQIPLPQAKDLPRGAYVGEVEIVDCVARHPSPWFEGPWGFVLANPRATAPAKGRGSLGFFHANV